MDKNKSAYKLEKLWSDLLLLILMGNQKEMSIWKTQFKYWEIDNYTRISAYDGRDDDLSDILKGKYPEMMSSGEVGCVTSHLKGNQLLV
jgi:GR25 family glycosyltransferase involved in LPS biosynthesis